MADANTPTTALPLPAGTVDLIFGPMIVGVFMNCIFYGVLVMQMFVYYQTYRRDAAWIRYFVLYLFIVETINTGMDIGMMYEPLVVRFGTAYAETFVPIMLSADPIVTVAISTPVQLFLAWRIRVISQTKWIPSTIAFFAICAFIGGVATTVSVTILNQYAKLQQFDGAVITWLASSAGADIGITISLIWSLYRRKTGNSTTDDIINRVIRLTVQTGMITAISAAADVIIFLTVPHTTLNFIWDFALSKLYTNSLMSTLNARAGWSNLANDNQTNNVLFGNTVKEQVETIGGSNRKRSKNSHSNAASTTLYEMGPTNTTIRWADSDVANDLEYGVAVTKVVEQLDDGASDLPELSK